MKYNIVFNFYMTVKCHVIY